MRLTVARAALIGFLLAGCLAASPAIECFEVRTADCELAADAAIPHFSGPPDRLVVTGARPALVVVGCTDDAVVAIVDIRVAEDGAIDARVRGHGPDLSHLCDNGPPS